MYIHIYIPYCFSYYRHYYDNTYNIINIAIRILLYSNLTCVLCNTFTLAICYIFYILRSPPIRIYVFQINKYKYIYICLCVCAENTAMNTEILNENWHSPDRHIQLAGTLLYRRVLRILYGHGAPSVTKLYVLLHLIPNLVLVYPF